MRSEINMSVALEGVHDTAAKGFTKETIASYEKGRPEWTASQVLLILEHLGDGSWACDDTGRYPAHGVLELGAGTGKLTRPLYAELKRRCRDGAEPNLVVVEPTSMGDALRAEMAPAPGSSAGVVFLTTTADKLTVVPSESLDGIVAAQAFHWFANVEVR